MPVCVRRGRSVPWFASRVPTNAAALRWTLAPFKPIAMMADRDPSTAPEVLWYYGGTGTGKTRKAYADNPGIYTWSGQWPWFHGYRGQETVLFDDFRGQIPFCSFLRLLDRYPCTVETKGGFMKWRAKKIIVTSALQPEDVYDKEKFHADDHIAQLLRRITGKHVFRQLCV